MPLLRGFPDFYEIQRINAFQHCSGKRQSLFQTLPTFTIRTLQALCRVREEALNGHRSSPLFDDFCKLLATVSESLGCLARIRLPFVLFPLFFLLFFPLLFRRIFGLHEAL